MVVRKLLAKFHFFSSSFHLTLDAMMPSEMDDIYFVNTCATRTYTSKLNMDAWQSRSKREENNFIIRLEPQIVVRHYFGRSAYNRMKNNYKHNTFMLFSWCAQVLRTLPQKSDVIVLGDVIRLVIWERSNALSYLRCYLLWAMTMIHNRIEPNNCCSSGITPKYRIDSERIYFHDSAAVATIHVVSIFHSINGDAKIGTAPEFRTASIKVHRLRHRLEWF